MHLHQAGQPQEVRMETIVAALDRAAEGAFLIDNNQRIIYWNRAAQEMLGYAPAEVLGRSCYDLSLIHISSARWRRGTDVG